ncbi:amidohydrolase 1, partial [Thozetella sp. PMI_491]
VIPGRGQPIPNAIIAVSPSSGKITHVGSQANFPNPPPKSKQVHVHCLLPGLWDVHAHFTGITQIDFPEMITTHPATCGAAIARSFHDTLMAGITSVRDVGSFAVEAHVAVEKGYILGPTVYGSGAAIGITGGSCDAVMFPADFMYARFGVDHSNYWAGCGMMVVADGVDECRRAVRQQIRRGAKCIKIVASGGVLSRTDDPQYRQYSDEELRVLVEESSLQGRAVAIHAHGKKGIMAAIKAGAHTIEHGSYIDEEAATLMKERGVTLVATRHVVEAGLKRLDKMHPATARKMVMVAESHKKAYQTAIRLGVKIAMGTDIAGAEPGTEMSPGKQASEL